MDFQADIHILVFRLLTSLNFILCSRQQFIFFKVLFISLKHSVAFTSCISTRIQLFVLKFISLFGFQLTRCRFQTAKLICLICVYRIFIYYWGFDYITMEIDNEKLGYFVSNVNETKITYFVMPIQYSDYLYAFIKRIKYITS